MRPRWLRYRGHSQGSGSRLPGDNLYVLPVAIQIVRIAVWAFAVRPLDRTAHVPVCETECVDVAGRFQGNNNVPYRIIFVAHFEIMSPGLIWDRSSSLQAGLASSPKMRELTMLA